MAVPRRVTLSVVRATRLALALGLLGAGPAGAQERPRARDLGIAPGIFAPGTHNAITDVAGVRVGHVTVVEGDSVRTGVTAILPHAGNPYVDRVPAALHVGNGFGKLLGATQLRELGEIETPILLTCTLCVWKAADAMVEWMLARPGVEGVGSINPVVGETNDGGLNAIRSRPIRAEHVRVALEQAASGPVAEGAVGAGAGTIAFGWKGGIGTSSRVLPATLGGHTVGVLVQSNFGGVLQVMGAPVGKELGRYSFRGEVDRERGDGSIMIVVATDAPLSDRNLARLAARAIMGLARTGSAASNGSGDYVLAFSTAASVRRLPGAASSPSATQRSTTELTNDAMSALFQGVVEATEEAIYNSMLRATTVTSRGRTVEALPIDRLREILRKYNVGAR
ncbi:MAG: P1 family peptidase [Gemmatimonadaceae bacterium]|nr:P1 family peptidase [Gemmatimonadaceae bacterium]